MPTASEKGGGDFQPAPAGTHIGRCIGCISLGTQNPNNPTFHPSFKVMLIFELPNERVKAGDITSQAMTISREFSCSLGTKSNLRPLLESWRGRPFTNEELSGFQVEKVIGHPCMITIIHKPKLNGQGIYANVSSVTALPKGMQAPPQVNESTHYEIEMKRNEVFAKLPEWIRKKIDACEEWQSGGPSSPNHEPEPEQELPPQEEEGDPSVPF